MGPLGHAIVAGVVIGIVSPATGVALKPLGDAFIALIRMLLPLIVFCTVVLGIAGAGDMKKVGRLAFRSIVYFEVVTTLALAVGLIAVNLVRPGDGVALPTDPGSASQFATALPS